MKIPTQRERLPNFKALSLPRTKPEGFETGKMNDKK